MIKFSVTVQGKTEFERAFNRISAAAEDFTPVWDGVRDWLKSRLRHQFNAEGSVVRWQSLSPDYSEWKQIHYPGTKILERTGHLKESLTTGNSDTIDRETKTLFEYGTRTAYGKYHQEGDGVPERKIFDFDERDRRDMTEAIQRPLIEMVRRQGFEVFEF